MTDLTEIDVMRAMVRAKIGRVGIWTDGVKGNCTQHKAVSFLDPRFNVNWEKKSGWGGCAQCILTCLDILEDPDMPTESEELVLRTELKPVRRMAPDIVALATFTVGLTLGALLL